MTSRNRRIAPSVRAMAKELKIDANTPELRVAEALASAIDGMDEAARARLLGQTVPPLLRALDSVRALAAPEVADEGRGLSQGELDAFLADLGAG